MRRTGAVVVWELNYVLREGFRSILDSRAASGVFQLLSFYKRLSNDFRWHHPEQPCASELLNPERAD
jgi:hypothetical protein